MSIFQNERQVATAVSDHSGHFQVSGLRGGTYFIGAGQTTSVCRLWAPNTAPPSARPGALVVVGDQQVLGQYGRVLHWFRNPWVVAGLVTAAIAIPVALHNADKDKEPQS